MARKWMMRLLCAILCLTLLLADVPAGTERAEADGGAGISVEEVISGESAAEEGVSGEVSPEELLPEEDPSAGGEAEPAQGGEPEPAPETASGEEEPEEREAANLDALVLEWIAGLDDPEIPDDYSRALRLYDRLISSFEPGDAEDAPGALATGSASPLGYALAYETLLRAAGIECETVRGEDSAWNIALLDGSWAHIDAYADDAPDRYGTHFGLNDAAMARDHRWTGEHPACTGAANSYFVRERGYAAFESPDELREILTSAVAGGARELYLFNAGAEPSVEGALTGLLAEIDPNIEAAVSEMGCYAAVRLRRAEDEAEGGEGAEPEPTAPAVIAPEVIETEVGSTEDDEPEIFDTTAEATPVSETSGEPAPVDAASSTAITFSKEAAEGSPVAIGVGESMTASCAFAQGASGGVSWTIPSEFSAYASVGRTSGKVTGKRASAEPVRLVATVGGQEIDAEFYVLSAATRVAFENSVSKNKLTLGVGERFTLGCVLTGYAPAVGAPESVLPNPADGKACRFTSSKSSVASVDERTGEITAIKAGTATITLKAYNAASKSACKKSVSVTVKKGLTDKFALAPEEAKLAKGDKLTVKANLDGGTAHLVWPTAQDLEAAGVTGITVEKVKGKNEAVVKAAADASAPGGSFELVLNADRYEDKQASATISLVEPYTPDDFRFSGVTCPIEDKANDDGVILLGIGETFRLSAGASDENHGGSIKKWKSSNSKIAKVSSSGTVTGKKAGTVTITATAFNSTAETPITATQKFKIVKIPTSLKYNAKAKITIYLGKGETQTLALKVGGYSGGKTAGGFYKSVSNTKPEFVEVDQSALPGSNELKITGVALGTSKITVKTYNSKSVVITVNVRSRPDGIALPEEEQLIAAGETLTLNATLTGAAGVPVYAALGWPKAEELVWSDTGEASGFTIKAVDNDTVKITAPKEIASDRLNQNILLTVRAEGYAQSEAPIGSASCTIRLIEAPVGQDSKGKPKSGCNMELSLERSKIGAGDSTIASFRFAEGSQVPEALREVSFSSSNSKIATVSAAPVEGKPGEYEITIAAKKAGKATVTAKAKRNGEKLTKTVTVVPAPTGITVTVDGAKNPKSLTMGVGEVFPIATALSPKNAESEIAYSFEPEGIAEFREDEDGKRIEALAVGDTKLTVATYKSKASRVIDISVKEAPTEILLNPNLVAGSELVMGVGASESLDARVNEGSAGKLHLAVTDCSPSSGILSFKDGKITAKSAGTATVQISTYAAAPAAPVSISLRIVAAPSAISFGEGNYAILLDGSAPLCLREKATLSRKDGAECAAKLTYSVAKDSKGKKHITIDKYGNVTPSESAVAGGKNKVTVKTHNGKKATVTVWVLKDFDTPLTLKRLNTPGYDSAAKSIGYLYEGNSYTPELYFFPEQANSEMKWTASGETDIISLNQSSGDVTAKAASHNCVTITGTSVANPDLKVSYKLYVLTDYRELTMPARHVLSVGREECPELIANNRTQMNQVRESAYCELDKLVATGKITASEANRRKGYIDRAFGMYNIPWRTDTTVPYWRAANSINGKKNFRKNILYFGVPYTQTTRNYDRAKFLTCTKKNDTYGFYQATSAFTGRGQRYPGSDCSSFVSMAIWASAKGRGTDNTSAIARASYYKTIGSWNSLRPGDLICKGGSHVVMFLYYTDSSKSEFCIIEQGGTEGEDFTNCVSPYIYSKTHYSKHGYKIRRVKSLA